MYISFWPQKGLLKFVKQDSYIYKMGCIPPCILCTPINIFQPCTVCNYMYMYNVLFFFDENTYIGIWDKKLVEMWGKEACEYMYVQYNIKSEINKKSLKEFKNLERGDFILWCLIVNSFACVAWTKTITTLLQVNVLIYCFSGLLRTRPSSWLQFATSWRRLLTSCVRWELTWAWQTPRVTALSGWHSGAGRKQSPQNW